MEKKSKSKGGILYCKQCNFSHTNQKVLDVHVQIHAGPVKFGCPYCEYTTPWRQSISTHISTKHSKVKRIRHCPYCDFTTGHRLDRLEDHIELNHRYLISICFFCDYSTTDKLEIMEHVNIEHNNENSYRCWDCHYKTSDISSFNEHFQKFHNRQVMYCGSCDYSTVRKQCWNRHLTSGGKNGCQFQKPLKNKPRVVPKKNIMNTDNSKKGNDTFIDF